MDCWPTVCLKRKEFYVPSSLFQLLEFVLKHCIVQHIVTRSAPCTGPLRTWSSKANVDITVTFMITSFVVRFLRKQSRQSRPVECETPKQLNHLNKDSVLLRANIKVAKRPPSCVNSSHELIWQSQVCLVKCCTNRQATSAADSIEWWEWVNTICRFWDPWMVSIWHAAINSQIQCTAHLLYLYAFRCVCDCTSALVCLCVLVLSEIDRWETVFILFNLSLISLVRNFNFCNKSVRGYRREEKSTYARCKKRKKNVYVFVLVNSPVCARLSMCVF